MGPTATQFTLHKGDSRNLANELARIGFTSEPQITATITSPPYGQLKNYGAPHQLGWNQSFDDYLNDCGRIFSEIFTATRVDGTLWLVVDTIRQQNGRHTWKLEPLPFQLAQRAESSGWMLRDVIIWRKDRTLPWSNNGRLRNAFEYVIQLVKSDDFKYYKDRLRIPTTLSEWWVRFPERYHPLGTMPTNVWDIPIPRQGAWKPAIPRHSCPLPAELVDRLILLSTDPGDVVLDPFAGTGIVLARSAALRRRAIGFDLQQVYIDEFSKTWPAYPLLDGPELGVSNDADTTLNLRRLRALKLPLVLCEALRKSATYVGPLPIAAIVLADPRSNDDLSDPRRYVEARIIFVTDEYNGSLHEALLEAAKRRPASKFGVAASIDVCSPARVSTATRRKYLYLYENGVFWRTTGRTSLSDVFSERPHSSVRRMRLLSNLDLRLENASIGI